MNELELRRRAMMSVAVEQGLPSKYQEVEYLENSGTQYLKTPYTSNIDSHFYFEYATVGEVLTNYSYLWGFIIGGSVDMRNGVFFRENRNGTTHTGCGMKWYNNLLQGSTGGRKTEVTLTKERLNVNIIGSRSWSATPNQDFTEDSWKQIWLFSVNGYAYPSAGCRFYRWTAYEQDKTMCDMIPCYRKADIKPGMYDLVSRKFFTNSGTGEFIVGPDVNN